MSASTAVVGVNSSGTGAIAPAGKPRWREPSSSTILHSGSYITPGRTTLGEWVNDSWLPMTATRVKPTTLRSYRRSLEIHVLPTLGSKRLQQLTPTMLNTLYATLASYDTSGRGGLGA
jgi:hypothetical protein